MRAIGTIFIPFYRGGCKPEIAEWPGAKKYLISGLGYDIFLKLADARRSFIAVLVPAERFFQIDLDKSIPKPF